jgi:uncharacterized membrane protein
MRFSHSSLVAITIALAACGNDTDPKCDAHLTYENFGAPFIDNWCRACHSVTLPAGMRQMAPTGMDFDTLDEVRAWSVDIDATSGHGSTMPPAGGPSQAERELLVQWLRCGAT